MHVLDYDEIDEIDEVDDGRRLVLIWCETHQVHEWHWVPENPVDP